MQVSEADFYDIVQNTWSSTLGFQVLPASSPEPVGNEALTVGVRMTGAWEGEVCLRCVPPLARLFAAAMFRVDPDSVGSGEISDALSELIHITAGNLKALLPQPVSLSLPTVSGLGDGSPPAPQMQIVCRLALQSEGYAFTVVLLQGVAVPALGQARQTLQ